MVFLSTSRVYPILPIQQLTFVEQESRFSLVQDFIATGESLKMGLLKTFPLEGARTLYGATKLYFRNVDCRVY